MSEDDRFSGGYGNPPAWTRFQKGKSGNPKGRPKKVEPSIPLAMPQDDPAKVMQQRVLSHTVKTRVDGQVREVTIAEANLWAIVTGALKGDGPSQRHLSRVTGRQGDWAARAALAEREAAKVDFERIVEWRDSLRTIWHAAQTRGAEPLDPWPHPGDVLLDEATLSYRVRGPLSERDLPLFEYMRAERDMHLHLGVLAWRGNKPNRPGWFAFHNWVWTSHDAMLPLRWQLGTDPTKAVLGLVGRSIRELRQRHREAAAEVKRLRPPPPTGKRAREVYAEVNAVMKPVLERLGYRSFAQFERAYIESGGEMP